MPRTAMREPWDIPTQVTPSADSYTNRDQQSTPRLSYSTTRTTMGEGVTPLDRWSDAASPTTTEAPSPYTRKYSFGKSSHSSDRVDYPKLSKEIISQDEELSITRAARGTEQAQPHKKVVLATKYNRATTMGFRRGRSKRQWEENLCHATEKSCKPVVSSPASVRRIGSFSNVQQCLEDQQRRSVDLIPPHVILLPQKSSRSLLSMAEYDVSPKQLQDEEETATTTRPGRSTAGSDLVPPCWLDKSYLRRLAGNHRTSICGSPASKSFGRADSCGSSRRSTITSDKHSFVAPKPILPESLDLPQWEARKPGPQRTQQQLASTNDMQVVEVCPGLSVPLRGSEATKRAVANNFYIAVACFGCATQICCIADVSYTICPLCRIISPVEEHGLRGATMKHRWGLGLGFTSQDLFEMETKIATSRSAQL